MMKIPIKHLHDGEHHFSENLQASSLKFYRQEIYPHLIAIEVSLDKFGETIRCNGRMKTIASYCCDRCLENYEEPVEISFELLFRVDENSLETDEENVVQLSPDTIEFDLTDRLIEFLILDIPMKMVCDKNCKGLCAGCGADLNKEACHCDVSDIDPRWEKLLSLKKQ